MRYEQGEQDEMVGEYVAFYLGFNWIEIRAADELVYEVEPACSEPVEELAVARRKYEK